MIPVSWFKMTPSDVEAMKLPTTYVKWIVDIAQEAGYIQNVAGVLSVNTLTGDVILTTDEINEGSSNLYFTNVRAIAAIAGQPISIFTNDAGYLTDAPSDGFTYGRNNGSWIPAGAGSAIWGGITGTLSDQTDLQTELNFKQPLNTDLTVIGALTPTNDDVLQRKAGAWTNRSLAQLRTDLSLQPLDADLSAIAALGFSSTAFLKKTALNTWALDTNTYLTSYSESDPLFAAWLAGPPNISTFTNDAGYITSTGITPAALTKTDDTNVTLTLGGTPATALLQATSLTLGWTGTLADGRIASATTWNAKQDALVSGTNIKTVNSSTLLGSGNLAVGDALVANPLSQFAATTSLQLKNTISDETGSGALVFATGPVLDAPNVNKITNLTTNGFVKTGSGDGTLSVDTSTYLTSPTWVDYSATSTVVGWLSFTTKQVQYAIVGKVMHVQFHFSGTSNSGASSFTIPSTSSSWTGDQTGYMRAQNNGGTIVMSSCAITAGISVVTMYPTVAHGNWTNSGTKQCIGQITISLA